MTNHVALAAVGFAAFVFAGLIASFAQSLHARGRESSYLSGRMILARKIGLGWLEQHAQSHLSLLLQKWIAFAIAASALVFTVWHAAMAFVSE
jgi:hypothetical protein